MFIFFFGSAGLIPTFCLFIVFSIDCCVVLVLAATALALLLTLRLFSFIDRASKQVTLFAAELAHKILLWLVTLDSNLVYGVLDLGLSIDVVFETADHIFLSKVILAIIVGDLAR